MSHLAKNGLAATGYSARLLIAGRKAVAQMGECPCGQKVLAFLKTRTSLREVEIRLCRKGCQRSWLQTLLAAGIVWWTFGCGKRSVTIYVETPLWFALPRPKVVKKHPGAVRPRTSRLRLEG